MPRFSQLSQAGGQKLNRGNVLDIVTGDHRLVQIVAGILKIAYLRQTRGYRTQYLNLGCFIYPVSGKGQRIIGFAKTSKCSG